MAERIAIPGTLFKDGITTIAQVRSGEISGRGREEHDTTTWDSTAEIFDKGLVQYGTMSVNILWDPVDSTHTDIETNLLADTDLSLSIELQDTPGTVISFTARCIGFEIGLPERGFITADVSFRLRSNFSYS